MSEKAKEPVIRFKGFSGDWEEKKVGDYLTLSRILGHTGVDAKKLTVKLWAKGVVEKTDIYGGSENTQYYVRHTGQFMYGKLDFLHAAFGIVPESLDGYESTLDSPAFDLKGIDGSFLLNRVSQDDFYLKYGTIANGSRKAKRIHEDTFLAMPIDVPSLSEQQKIGSYFRQLDRLITLYQRKYNKLTSVKKSMLQKMFPASDQTVPALRFAGFTDKWEVRKLGELGEIITGSTPSTSKSEYYSDDGIPWVTPTDINALTISDTPRKLSEEGIKVGRVVPANTILCTCIASIGKNALLMVKGSFNQQINGLIPNAENDAYFLLTESELWSETMKRIAASGTMQIVNKTEFSELTTMLPSLSEQQKIGSYFRQLDHLIALHQQELQKLQNLKKACLKKMFV